MSSTDEAKTLVGNLFRDFNEFVRHMFSGIVAVLLFEAGRIEKVDSLKKLFITDLNLSKVILYIAVALAVGTIVYLYERYVLCETIMYRLSTKYKWLDRGNKLNGKDGNICFWGMIYILISSILPLGFYCKHYKNYCQSLGDFIPKRFHGTSSNSLNDYLISAWSWTHGLASVGLILIIVPLCYFKWCRYFYLGVYGYIFILVGILFLLAYIYKICQLLCFENMAYNDYKSTSTKDTEQKNNF